MLPRGVETWSLTGLQQRLVETPAGGWSNLVATTAVDGEPSDAAPVLKHAAPDCGFAAASGIGASARQNRSGRQRGVDTKVSEQSLENKATPGFCVPETALSGLPEPLGWERMQETDPVGVTAGILARSRERKIEIPAYIHLASPRCGETTLIASTHGGPSSAVESSGDEKEEKLLNVSLRAFKGEEQCVPVW